MSSPTLKAFVIRVGGVFGIFTLAILIAKAFFPGYEGVAVFVVAGSGFAVLLVRSLLKKSRSLQRNRGNRT